MATNCTKCGTSLDGRDPRATLCLKCRQERDNELSRQYKERQKKKKEGA